MAFKIAEAYVEVGAKTAKASANLKGFKARLASTGRALDSIAHKAKWAFAGAGAAIGLFVKKASEAEEIGSKFAAVFKEEADAADAFVTKLGAAVGRANMDLKGFMATLQDTFVPLGFARDKARMFSQQLTQLAIDVASFNNQADADVIRDFQSAIVGNHETVRKYGIIITEASVGAELMAMGINKTSKEATAAEKAQARLNIIMKGTADAQGDAVRTAGSFANQLKRLKSEVTDAAEAIGTTLLPIATDLVKQLTAGIEPIKEWATAHKELIPKIAKWTLGLTGAAIILPKVIRLVIALSKAMTWLAKNPLVLAIAAIAALTAALVFTAIKLRETRQEIEKMQTTVDLGFDLKPYEDLESVTEDIALATDRVKTAREGLERAMEEGDEAAIKRAKEFLSLQQRKLDFIGTEISRLRDLAEQKEITAAAGKEKEAKELFEEIRELTATAEENEIVRLQREKERLLGELKDIEIPRPTGRVTAELIAEMEKIQKRNIEIADARLAVAKHFDDQIAAITHDRVVREIEAADRSAKAWEDEAKRKRAAADEGWGPTDIVGAAKEWATSAEEVAGAFGDIAEDGGLLGGRLPGEERGPGGRGLPARRGGIPDIADFMRDEVEPEAKKRRRRFTGLGGIRIRKPGRDYRLAGAARELGAIGEEEKKAAKDKALESAPVDILKETKIGNEWLKKIHEESKKSDVAKMAP